MTGEQLRQLEREAFIEAAHLAGKPRIDAVIPEVPPAERHTDLPDLETNYSQDTWIRDLKSPLDEKGMEILNKYWPVPVVVKSKGYQKKGTKWTSAKRKARINERPLPIEEIGRAHV